MSGTSIIAYFVLTLSVLYAFVYPAYGDISALMSEKQKYDDSLATVATIEDKKRELLAKFNNISDADKKDIETLLPSSLSFVKLVSQIDTVASKYGISIDRITKRELSSSVGDSIAEAQPERPYNSAIIGFSFTASYDKFKLFMSELEKSLRILDVKSVKVNVSDKGEYDYSVEFETYWLD
jgi:Tfp pilus assembly protein PilO